MVRAMVLLAQRAVGARTPRRSGGAMAATRATARRSPLAGGTRGRYALLSKADTGTLVDALVTPSTRHHAIETTNRDAHRSFTTQVRDAS